MSPNTCPQYEVVVVGGGPAGLTTALYTTRLGHQTAVFEGEGGRHAAVNHVHNVLGISPDISGRELASHALEQVETYGGDIYLDIVENIDTVEGDYPFRLEAAHATVESKRVVLATGFRDHSPDVPGLREFTGRGLYYCLHCDAYALGDGSVYVLGHDDDAAHAAMTMLNFTEDVDLLLDGRDPQWDDDTDEQLRAHPIERVEPKVVETYTADTDDDRFGGLTFTDGTARDYLGGFAMYGMTYNTPLAESLECDLTDDGAIDVDERRETSVEGVYAVGDVTHGQNQTPIAIGDGAYAGISIHKDIRRFPLSLETIDSLNAPESGTSDSPVTAPGTGPELRARMRRMQDRTTNPGLRGPPPDR
ncbi:NAD(P)/FAD-dependent oxidoreductase [Halostagnicola kamekurae]|uniref:Thioredoxin reductase (NADPH) n=1 Tax=Halostagnicola kamekurae TaxID=619731 RepID=A0A1I6TQK4_9EURY|nr:NAD(P)/FAD-dependent oxidoreductase [Halostagnicola kamekurae]SFS91476.1 thioredoxin reductase (NADPH) [Halostagnicola kamekurae]